MVMDRRGFYGQYLKKAPLEALKQALPRYEVDAMDSETQNQLRRILFIEGADGVQSYADNYPDDFAQFLKLAESSGSSSNSASTPSMQPSSPDAPQESLLEELEAAVPEYNVRELDPLNLQKLQDLLSREGVQGVAKYINENKETFEPYFNRSAGKRKIKSPPASPQSSSPVSDFPESPRATSVSRARSNPRAPGSIMFHESSPSSFSVVPEWIFHDKIRTNDSYPPSAKIPRTWERKVLSAPDLQNLVIPK